MRVTATTILVGLIAVIAGCGSAADRLFCDDPTCAFTSDEWRRLKTLSPMPAVPADPSNRFRDVPEAAALGKAFYFDPRFSGPATEVDALGRATPPARAPRGAATGVSCATCHDLARGGVDVTSTPGNVSAGAGWTDVNSLPTVNSAYVHLWFWNGRADSSWALAVAVAESRTTMNGNRLKTAWVIADNYRDAYDTVFGPAGFTLPLTGTSADVAVIVDPATGQCAVTNGVCPAPCRTVPGPPSGCWPAFPLQGKPGAKRDCQPGDSTEPFGDAWDCMDAPAQTAVIRVLVNWAKALDAYQATLVSGETSFDRFVAEGSSSLAISAAAKRGARLFVSKAACIDCHAGPLLSDGSFHNIGVPQAGPLVPTLDDCPAGGTCDCVADRADQADQADQNCLPWGLWDGMGKLGRNKFLRGSTWSDDPGDISRQPDVKRPQTNAFKGAWRTPSLRNVALTAPYMHDGLYPTLADVVAHYNAGGAPDAVGFRAPQVRPLFLTAGEQVDLVAFLETLTAPPLPSNLTSQLTSPGASR